MVYDFKALRFPSAPLRLNKLLDAFIESSDRTLSIITIDPSLKRCIEQRIAHRELPLTLSSESYSETITKKHKDAWALEFDEEDFEDVSQRLHYCVNKGKG